VTPATFAVLLTVAWWLAVAGLALVLLGDPATGRAVLVEAGIAAGLALIGLFG
jgi:hypothetical protein